MIMARNWRHALHHNQLRGLTSCYNILELFIKWISQEEFFKWISQEIYSLDEKIQ